MNKALVVLGTLALLVTSLMSTPAGSNTTDSASFRAVGVVADANASVDPAPPESGLISAFVLNPVSEASGSVEGFVGPEGLKIHETLTTSYLKLGADGKYHAASRSEVVVATEEVRVKGARITGDPDTATFVADTVWNPPNEPLTGGSLPACFSKTGLKSGSFNLIAKVERKRVHYPCTGLDGYPGGFTQTFRASETDLALQDDPTAGETSPAETAAIEAYGGRLELYISPFTQYVLDGQASDYANTVVRGEIVQAKGTYYFVNGAWLFVVEKVFNPAQAAATSFRPSAGFDAVESGQNDDGSVNYEGVSTGPNFPAPDSRFSATVSWTPTITGWAMSGTYRVDNGGATFIEGTLSGTATSNSFAADLTITDAGGFWAGSTGTGTMSGEVVPQLGSPFPTAINGTASWTIAK